MRPPWMAEVREEHNYQSIVLCFKSNGLKTIDLGDTSAGLQPQVHHAVRRQLRSLTA